MPLSAIRARLGSIPHAKRLKIALISTAADRLLTDITWLVNEVHRLRIEVRSLTDQVRRD